MCHTCASDDPKNPVMKHKEKLVRYVKLYIRDGYYLFLYSFLSLPYLPTVNKKLKILGNDSMIFSGGEDVSFQLLIIG